jgi:CBS domain-containing protein
MTPDPITCSSDVPVDVALETMTSNDVRRLPVVSRTGHVAGIITRFDAMYALKKDDNWFAADTVPPVKEVMTANVFTVEATDTVAHAARLMINYKIGGLPVVDDAGKLIGILTESDLFRYLADQLDPEGKE